MNYATIFSYIFCIMSIQSRIISPHNSKTRDKLVMLTCFLKIVLDSDIQQFGQLSTFVSLNSIIRAPQMLSMDKNLRNSTPANYLR